MLVVGDVNSTIACGQVARAHHISIAHVEAGLRSFDPGMPEELNRVATDRISNYLFEIDAILGNRYKHGAIPPLWDGHAAERIAEILEREMRPSSGR